MNANHPEQVPQGHRTRSADIRLQAVSENVPRVRGGLVRAARAVGADERMCKRIALAVTEATTNAVLHAFPDRPGFLRAHLSEHDGEIEVVVSDDGRGLTLRDDSPGLGMGLGIIAEVADTLEIATAPGEGTEIRMGFRPRDLE
jgi:anti-sigma regulatory factor (Ser/Thr protein kinase)